MALTDLAVVGRLGTDELAAAGLGVMLCTVSMVPMLSGPTQALKALASQAFGAKSYLLVGTWFRVALWTSILLCAPVVLVWVFAAKSIFSSIGISDEVAALAARFCALSSLWTVPMTLSMLLGGYLQAQGVVVPQLLVQVLWCGINVALNIVLVHGVGGWPGLGFSGSPLATAASRAGVALSLSIAAWWLESRSGPAGAGGGADSRADRGGGGRPKCFGRWSMDAFDPQRVRTFLGQAAPLALGSSLEEFQLQLITGFAGALGSSAVAAHSSLMEAFYVLTSFEWAAMQATTTIVGHRLGAGEPWQARHVGRVGLAASSIIGVVVAVTLFLLRDELGKIFSRDPEVWHLMSKLTYLLAGGYALLSLFYNAMAILQAQARALAVMVSFLIGAWFVAVPLAYLLAYHPGDMGLIGLWIGMTAGYGVVTLISSTFVLRSNWPEASRLARERSEATDPLLENETGSGGGFGGGAEVSPSKSINTPASRQEVVSRSSMGGTRTAVSSAPQPDERTPLV